jgi:hypothetical protein
VISAIFSVRFTFSADAAQLKIQLEADVQKHHTDSFYEITNFHVPGHRDHHVLPSISIRKVKGRWVHVDSGKSSDLSEAVGKAIENAEAT